MKARFALGMLMLAVTACEGTATSPHPTVTSHPAAEPPAAAPSMGPGDVPIAKTVQKGQQFEVSYTYPVDSSTGKWRLTLSEVRCGGPQIFDQKILAAGSASVPHPDNGMQFCLVKFAPVINESNSNKAWTASNSSLNVGMRAYESSVPGPAYEAESAYQSHGAPPLKDSTYGLNPGVSGVSWALFQIPAGATPTSMSVPIGTITLRSTTEQVLIHLG